MLMIPEKAANADLSAYINILVNTMLDPNALMFFKEYEHEQEYKNMYATLAVVVHEFKYDESKLTEKSKNFIRENLF